MGVATLGRPRTRKAVDPDAKPKPLLVQMDAEFWDWIEEFAKSEDRTKAELVELALVELARSRRFPKPAPPRLT